MNSHGRSGSRNQSEDERRRAATAERKAPNNDCRKGKWGREARRENSRKKRAEQRLPKREVGERRKEKS